jgi:hypothetical protein
VRKRPLNGGAMLVAKIDVSRRFTPWGLARLVRLFDLPFFLGHSFLQVFNSEFPIFDALADPAGCSFKLFTHCTGEEKVFSFALLLVNRKLFLLGSKTFFSIFLQRNKKKSNPKLRAIFF